MRTVFRSRLFDFHGNRSDAITRANRYTSKHAARNWIMSFRCSHCIAVRSELGKQTDEDARSGERAAESNGLLLSLRANKRTNPRIRTNDDFIIKCSLNLITHRVFIIGVTNVCAGDPRM